jgi:hypothetical protein
METLRWAIIGAVAIIWIATSSAGADSKSATELLEDAKQVPQKTVEFVKKEYSETVEFQRAGWADAKAQTDATVSKLKGFFSRFSKEN